MQFVDLRRINREEIFGVLDIDPTKLGILEDSNRSTSKESDNSFREDTISPLQSVVEEEVNDTLILELFGWDDILMEHEDQSPRARLSNLTFYRDAVRDGLMLRNEARAEIGRGPIKGGEVPTISTSAGVVPLERLLEEPDPAQVQAQQSPQVRPQDNEANGTRGVNPNEDSE
jgi:phage portal protein BeeE